MRQTSSLPHTPSIPEKANRVLHIIFVGFILLFIRLWYLTVIVHDQRLEEAQRPRERTLILPAKRASIRDRFNIPLAINTMRYRATIIYADLRDVPSIAWEKNSFGRKTKRYVRREYISALSDFLGNELGLDPTRVEDLIYSKAALYYQLPFVVKEDLTETQYYRLKAREADWPGLHVKTHPKREYPFSRVAGEVIGYMGAINQKEYEKILNERYSLRESVVTAEHDIDLPLPYGYESLSAVQQRLEELEELAYTLNDSVGKAGVEGEYEEDLRGYRGMQKTIVDARGRYVRSLPDSLPWISGKRCLLTLSIELQQFCEEALIQNEKIRQVLSSNIHGVKKTTVSPKEPWIKGGAIIAMDPNTGEILAMASHPRFDPNDFIRSDNPQKKKREHIARWFETTNYLGAIWNQQIPLEREIYERSEKKTVEEAIWMHWDTYLDFLLPANHEIIALFAENNTIESLVALQESLSLLLETSEQSQLHYILDFLYKDEEEQEPYDTTFSAAERFHLERIFAAKGDSLQKIRTRLDPIFSRLPLHYDKVLFADLCHLVVPAERFSPLLRKEVGKHSIHAYKDFTAACTHLLPLVERETRTLYHERIFLPWREQYQSSFLQQIRRQEKEEGRMAKPYLDVLDAEEERQFVAFWESSRWDLFLAFLGRLPEGKDLPSEVLPFLQTLSEWGAAASARASWKEDYSLLQQMIAPLDPSLAQMYLATARSYNELNKPLWGRYPALRKEKGQQTEQHLALGFYPRYGYGYARSHAFRQATIQGSIFKLVTAYEALVQRYRQLDKPTPSLAELNPMTIVDEVYKRGETWYLGYTEAGKPLPQFYKGGRLPRSQISHIGDTNIVKAIECSSNPYFSLLASEWLATPNDLIEAAKQFSYGRKTGIDLPFEIAGKLPVDVDENKTELYSFAIGQGAFVATPLQTAVMVSALANGGTILQPRIVQMKVGADRHHATPIPERTPITIRGEIFLPEAVRDVLMQGMEKMVERSRTTHIGSLQQMYKENPEWVQNFANPSQQWLGKTSTAEAIETLDLDGKKGRQIYSHVWFGGISFAEEEDKETYLFHDALGRPELVVIVYLRYGGYGKEVGPLALAVANQWRAIQKAHLMHPSESLPL